MKVEIPFELLGCKCILRKKQKILHYKYYSNDLESLIAPSAI